MLLQRGAGEVWWTILWHSTCTQESRANECRGSAVQIIVYGSKTLSNRSKLSFLSVLQLNKNSIYFHCLLLIGRSLDSVRAFCAFDWPNP